MLTKSQQRFLDADPNGATQLAVLLSLASLVDPGLLREARIALKLPVSAELELRAGPLVSSGSPAGLVLADAALPELRARLHPELFDLAWNLTRARHDALSPALVLEETLTWQALSGDPSSDADAELQLNRALVAILRGKKTQLAAWAARALPRLPERVRDLRSARYLASAVQLSGYRTSVPLQVDGPPPAWMSAPQPATGVQASLALYESTLEITSPPRDGEQPIPLPANRQVWISWWQNGQRVWAERTVPRTGTLTLPVAGAEITIEAPTLGRILIQDEAAQRVEFAYFDSISTDGPNDLIDYLQRRLSEYGRRVAPGFPSFYSETYSRTAASDFLLIIATGPNIGDEGPFLDFITSQCRPMIFVQGPGSSNLPPFVEQEAIPVSDFRTRSQWDSSLFQLLGQLDKGPPPIALFDGVPPLPPVFVRRPAIFDNLKGMLMLGTTPIINLYGMPGSGRTTAAVDILHDCAIRRRFHGGIFWGDKEHRNLPDDLPHPCLIVAVDMDLKTYADLDVPEDLVSKGSRGLLLTTEPFSQDFPVPAIDGDSWWMAESLLLFEQAVSMAGNHEEIDAALDLVKSGPNASSSSKGSQPFDFMNARMIANLGGLAGMAVRSKAELNLPPDMFPLSEARRQLLFHLDLVAPFAACPPNWRFPEPDNAVWRRYFTLGLQLPIARPNELLAAWQQRISSALDLLTAAFPERILSDAASNALFELAFLTHRRIVESYRDECGGDWASGPDDGYFLEHFAWHLWHAYPDQITDLTENIDWLWRADREAPEWYNRLRKELPYRPFDRAKVEQPFHSFATKWLHDAPLFEAVEGSVAKDHYSWGNLPANPGRRMVEARLAMMQGRFQGRILVVGTLTDQLDPILARLSEAVGRELARWGYSLLTDGAPGVDATAAKAYAAQLASNNIAVKDALFDSLRIAFPAEPRQGGYDPLEGPDGNDALIDQSDAIIAIGGDDRTLALCRLALQQGKPVLPIRLSSGAAETLFDEIFTLAPYLAALPTLELPITTPSDCYQLAQALIPFLPTASPEPPTESFLPREIA